MFWYTFFIFIDFLQMSGSDNLLEDEHLNLKELCQSGSQFDVFSMLELTD